jgi:hypothetical protein
MDTSTSPPSPAWPRNLVAQNQPLRYVLAAKSPRCHDEYNLIIHTYSCNYGEVGIDFVYDTSL